MRFCKYCGNKVGEEDTICPACGKNISPVKRAGGPDSARVTAGGPDSVKSRMAGFYKSNSRRAGFRESNSRRAGFYKSNSRRAGFRESNSRRGGFRDRAVFCRNKSRCDSAEKQSG